jgi:hypothetical protein
VTVVRGPDRRTLIVAGVWVACACLVVVALWVLSGFATTHQPTASTRKVVATVRTAMPCQDASGNALGPESVTFTLDGLVRQAKVDACGHQPGDPVDVLAPASFTQDTVLALAGAQPGDASGLSHRVAFLLLVVATSVGGASGYLIFRGRRATPAGAKADTAPEATPTTAPPTDETGTNWFIDSSAGLPFDLGERARRS